MPHVLLWRSFASRCCPYCRPGRSSRVTHGMPLRLLLNVKRHPFGCLFTGGDKGTRTPDFCIANAALYQLSYIPKPAVCHASQPVYHTTVRGKMQEIIYAVYSFFPARPSRTAMRTPPLPRRSSARAWRSPARRPSPAVRMSPPAACALPCVRRRPAADERAGRPNRRPARAAPATAP